MSLLSQIRNGAEIAALDSRLEPTNTHVYLGIRDKHLLSRHKQNVEGLYEIWKERLEDIPRPAGALERIFFRTGYELGLYSQLLYLAFKAPNEDSIIHVRNKVDLYKELAIK